MKENILFVRLLEYVVRCEQNEIKSHPLNLNLPPLLFPDVGRKLGRKLKINNNNKNTIVHVPMILCIVFTLNVVRFWELEG